MKHMEANGLLTPMSISRFPADGLPLTIPNQSMVPNAVWPSTVVLPMPADWDATETAESSLLGLFENGVRIPAQLNYAEKWGTGAPKIIHVTGNFRYRNGTPLTYRIKGTTGTSPTPLSTLTVVENASQIVVDTAAIKFVVRKGNSPGLDAFQYDPVARRQYNFTAATTICRPVIVDQNGTEYKPSANTVTTVNRFGVTSATITATGSLGPYATYSTTYTVYAGLGLVKIKHSVTFTGTSANQVQSVGYRIPTTAGYTQCLAGIDGSTRTANDITVLQYGNNKGAVWSTGVPESAFTKTDGWFAVRGGYTQISLMVKNLCDRYPTEVETSAAGITYYTWPKHSRPYPDGQPSITTSTEFAMLFGRTSSQNGFTDYNSTYDNLGWQQLYQTDITPTVPQWWIDNIVLPSPSLSNSPSPSPSISLSPSTSPEATQLVSGVVAAWHLDETVGTVKLDSNGGNHLTTYGNSVVSGKMGMAYGASGNYNYGRTNSSALSIAGDMTISLWTRIDSKSIYSTLVSKFDQNATAQRSYMLAYDRITDRFRFYMVSGTVISSVMHPLLPTVGMWYHLIARRDASGIRLRVSTPTSFGFDGVLNTTKVPNPSTVPFSIGNTTRDGSPDATGNYYLNGVIDELVVWNRAITDAESYTLYNAGAGLAYPFS